MDAAPGTVMTQVKCFRLGAELESSHAVDLLNSALYCSYRAGGGIGKLLQSGVDSCREEELKSRRGEL